MSKYKRTIYHTGTRGHDKKDAVRQRTAPGRDLYRTSRWKEIRTKYLREHRVCVECGKRSKHVDHIRPHRGDERAFFDATNWQPLCHSCHSRKTARHDGAFGNAPGAEAQQGGCDATGEALHRGHPWYEGE